MCGYKPAKYVHQITKYGHLDSFLATHTLYGHQLAKYVHQMTKYGHLDNTVSTQIFGGH